ncbi:MAG: glycosyltransferase family 2 protein [Bacteroidota bacterium]
MVNYNVEYFLEQCLNSCVKALQNVEGEIFVVDNNSIDGSNEMVKAKFPSVHLIENKKNLGFSTANNQAVKLSQGKYVLLLNPDTVVEEDTFEKVVRFMDEHADAGGLGVRMLDGKGRFLPESKRGLPTPSVAFYKIFGLSALFPKSKLFGKYHLGYLSEFKTHEVDVLSGAFMLLRKETLDKVGLLDEQFFMYGEDIDLSYRITLGGYKNYYFPETRIIHYKGESTKKSSVNYVFVFYRAMVIFAQKHFSKNNAQLFSFLINIAIYFRAGIAILARFIKKATLPAADLGFLIGGLFLLTRYWHQSNIEFPQHVIRYAIPSYAVVWLLFNLYSGTYDFPQKIKRFFFGTFLGTLFILVNYALLPKEYQFSRLYILTGTFWVISYYLISRVYLHFTVGKRFRLDAKTNANFIIVGSFEEAERVGTMLRQINPRIEQVYLVSSTEEKNEKQAGISSQLDQLTHNLQVDEVIFCAKDVSAQEIIQWMSDLGHKNLDFKIAQPDSLYLIGSNSINSAGDLYIININEISKKSKQRMKRTLDLLFSFGALITLPLNIWFFQSKWQFITNMLACLIGKKTLVGYHIDPASEGSRLPTLKKGILSPFDALKFIDEGLVDKLNLIYARDYNLFKDLEIIQKAWRKLDR